MLTDLQLLSRYHLHGDATAFRDLVQAHAGMVFATARRITRDQAMAEDVAQETFFQLARQSRHITQSVAAWLHRVAWRRACNAVRDDATRRRIEAEASASDAAVGEPTEHEATWAEVETALDEAIDELPDNLRAPLVMHFLQGRAQRDIAGQLGVSQSTVSRLVDEGLAVLRSQLKTRGLLCGAGLAALLMASNSTAAPATLLAALGKLSMSGIGASMTATAGAGAAVGVWLKAGIAALLAAGAFMILKSPTQSPTNAGRDVIVHSPDRFAQLVQPKQSPPAIAVPVVAVSAKPTSPTPAVSMSAAAPATGKPMPVHELVHSFPTPPKIPTGHLAQDDQGWLWGTSSGGRYGAGTLYRMNADGSVWEEMVSFNGSEGLPRGGGPWAGVSRAPDGRFWGMTGSASGSATIYCFDSRSGSLSTEIVFEKGEEPAGCPSVLPDGQIWFSTNRGVFRYDPATRQRMLVSSRGAPPFPQPQLGELVPDGRGWLWATCDDRRGDGSVCKVNQATGDVVVVLAFTGKAGTFPGSKPVCGLTLDPDGFLWGCTRNGGATDQGTVFKIHAETGSFTSVTHFQLGKEVNTGINPESMLADDGRGFMWGTATDGGGGGHGTIYKIERSTGKLGVVVSFSGIDGAAPGGTARVHLLRAGPDHFVGACNFWGAGWSGVIYRVDIATGQYAVLKDMADLATTTEGVEPHGSLVEASDGSFWGTTHFHGAHHCGTIYKLEPASEKLISVIDFTGREGTHPGRSPDAGLVSDGQGWLWGTTRSGGRADRGTIFKLHEQTGALTTVAEFGADSNTLRGGGPMTEMVLDERGQLWGTTFTTVFKVDPHTNAVKHIASIGGDQREPFGSSAVGRLAVDGRGYVWGCTQADRTHEKACLYRISTANDTLEMVEVYPHAGEGRFGWPSARMYRDSGGSIWFTGVLEHSGPVPRSSLNRLDPLTGRVVERHFSREFPIIETPVEDGHGRLWGAVAMDGSVNLLYTFDLATRTFQRALEFTGHGSQPRSGSQPMFGRPMRASDGNIYSVTRYGGPGNGGTIYRLRFGPTPMTQEAVILSDGRVELHGTLRPNGRDTEAAFEWGLDPLLKDARTLGAGTVRAGEAVKPLQAVLTGLDRGTTHYFRLVGRNADNAVPQRGAILQFTIPSEVSRDSQLAAASSIPSAAASSQSFADASAQASAPSTPVRYKLRIVMVPGAGAGIVRGWLRGESYEIGKSYTLTAQADNGYIFAQWSGAGISGQAAESPQLNFTFTEELARRPFITATFVRNPFHEGLLGPYHGLVNVREGVQPGIGTTGALEMEVTPQWTFTGKLHYDGDELPFDGVFDTGGSGRFGDALSFIGVIPRREKTALLLSLQFDLSQDGLGGIFGNVGLWRDEEATWQSQFHIMLSVPAATLAADEVIQHLVAAGKLNVEILPVDSAEATPAQVLLQPNGRLQLSANLPDNTVLLSDGHLSKQSHISFFQPLQGGNLGVEVPLANLLHRPQEPATANGWWLPSAGTLRPVTLQAAPSEAAEK